MKIGFLNLVVGTVDLKSSKTLIIKRTNGILNSLDNLFIRK